MEDRISKILDSKISKTSIDKDFDVNISLSNTNNLLPLNEVNSIVDQSEVFTNERESNDIYRFLGTFNPLISNVLFDITGPDSFQTIQSFLSDPDTKYNSTNEILVEKNGWFGYYSDNLISLCNFIELNPKSKDLAMYSNGIINNWTLKLTYPYSGSSETIFFNSNNSSSYPVFLKDGIAITSNFTINVGGKTMTAFVTPINHGLNIGDQVRLSGGTNYDGDYTVVNLGDEKSDNTSNIFIIDKFFTGSTSAITGTYCSFKRIVNGNESKYMARYFSAITRSIDVDFYKAGFSKTIYNDNVVNFNIKTDIDLGVYQDYLNRPITEVYLTICKTKTSGTYWSDILSGIEVKVPLSNYDIKQINGVYPINDLGVVNSSDDVFLGDIVDYNDQDLSERILESIKHRFNSNNRIANNYLEGYYYNPHNKIIIKYYSNNLEIADPNTSIVPDYAILKDGKYMWKDILTKGYFDESNRGVNYPFLNGYNYIYSNNLLLLKRQDPYWDYDHGNKSIFGVNCEKEIERYIIKDNDVC